MPRYSLKGGKLVDRWIGKRYQKSPAVMLSLLNAATDDAVAKGESLLRQRLGDAAGLADQLAAAKQEVKDAYALVKRERESCHDLANKLHELQADVDRACDVVNEWVAMMKSPSLEKLVKFHATLRKHATPTDQLPDNPFADSVKS